MSLDFGGRLGLAGLVVALFGIAAFYLWPDKRWIGSVCLAGAGVLLLAWGIVEIKQKIGSTRGALAAALLIGAVLGTAVAGLIWSSVSEAPKPSSPSDYSNAQIKDSAFALSRRLRQFQERIVSETMTLAMQQIKSQQDKNPMSQAEIVMRMARLGAQHESQFGPLRAESNTMIFHLQNRVPAPQPLPSELVRIVLSTGPLAGPNPVGSVADYIDQLAQLVPVNRP